MDENSYPFFMLKGLYMSLCANVVIGSSFGDEGKGNITNYLSDKDTTVIRFNGGANAGHTVCHNNKRHIFGHLGSGSFKGAKTHLSKYFILNPVLFKKECNELGFIPEVTYDDKCLVTTPMDMLANQLIEKARTNKHGSCGIGINETILRHEHISFNFCDFGLLWHIYKLIKSYYINRFEDLNIIDKISKSDLDLFSKLYTPFEKDIYFFINNARICNDDKLNITNNIVFEGAQGLCLDENSKYFPHVTHSKTGLDNVIEFIKTTNIDTLNVFYITRPYLTRHGNGPMPYENYNEFSILDKTNIENKWQGKFRYGILDIDEINNNISNDFKKLNCINATKNIAVTCLDQVPEKFKVILNGKEKKVLISDIFNSYDSKLLSYSCNGPIL